MYDFHSLIVGLFSIIVHAEQILESYPSQCPTAREIGWDRNQMPESGNWTVRLFGINCILHNCFVILELLFCYLIMNLFQSHQQQEEIQRTKMMLKFREDKIKRIELLSDGMTSADKFYLDENSALREENQLLQAKIEKNPEVIRFAMENIRLLEQIRL